MNNTTSHDGMVVYVRLQDGRINYTARLTDNPDPTKLYPTDTLIDHLQVEGNADLSEITSRNIKVRRITFSHRSTNVTIPPNLIIPGGEIDASNTTINSLPNGLVLDELLICQTPITNLPDDLVVINQLDISHTTISSLPIGVCSTASLCINNTAITSLPDYIDCDKLKFRGTSISEIPTTVRVLDSLETSSHVTTVPDTIDATTITTDATVIPSRHYKVLSISRSSVLQHVQSVRHLIFKNRSGEDTLIIPPHIHTLSVLQVDEFVHMHPDLIVTSTVRMSLYDGSIIPNTVILPTLIYFDDIDNQTQGIINGMIQDTVTHNVYRAVAEVYITNAHGIYSVSPSGGRPVRFGVDIMNVELLDTVLPDRKVIVADGYINQYTSVRTVGEYTIYKLVDSISKYVVTDGTYFYHGNVIRIGIEGILNKRRLNDTIEQIKLDVNTPLPIADAIDIYRSVTGACESGVDMFIEHIKSSGRYKNSYTPIEIIDLTVNRYGHDSFVKAVLG